MIAPSVFYPCISVQRPAAFARKQRFHLIFRCQTGHGNGVVVPERLSVPGDAGQGIAAACLFDLHGNAADHRQRTAVEGYKPSLAALHKGADGLLQLCAGHGALAGHQTVGHDHGSGHFLVIICLQHTAGKAVCGGKQHIGAINAPQRVRHNGEGGAAAVCVEDIGIALPGGQHDLVIGRRFFGKKLGIERTISLLCRVLARDHFGDNVLGDGKEIVGGDADIHVVFFHHIAHVLHVLGQAQGDILAVAQHVLSVGNDAVLRILREHDVQHLHGFFAARGVLLEVTVQSDLEIRGGHDPLFAVLAEEGQKNGVDALILKHLHAGRATKVHGNFPVAEHPGHTVVIQRKVVCRKMGILNELRHPLKGTRPHGIVQAHPHGAGGVAVSGAPLAPFRGGKLGSGKPLQRFHAGVVVGIIGGKAADAYRFKRLTGSNKACIIGGQGDIVLLKKAAVDHKAVGIRADRQPVHAAVLIFKAVEVGIVHSARLVGGGKVHQAVLQGGSIVQREPAAGDDIRQTAVLLQKLVKIQIIVAHDELNVHIRQLGLDIGCINFVETIAPQIHLNGLGILLLLYLLCALAAAAGQQRKPYHQCRKRGNKAMQCFFVRQIRSPHNSWAAAGLRQSCYGSLVRTSPPARVCALKPAHGNDAVIFAYFLFCAAPFPRKGTVQ